MKRVIVFTLISVITLVLLGCPQSNNTETPSIMIEVEAPVFKPESSTVTNGSSFTLSSATENATIYYTSGDTAFKASNPSEDGWTQYKTAVSIDFVSTNEITFRAIAVKSGMLDSSETIATFSRMPTATVPMITPTNGIYDTGEITVTISSLMDNASFYYTTDGSNPLFENGSTQGSTKEYSKSFTISLKDNASIIIKAITVIEGYVNSSIATATYTPKGIVEMPQITPNGGAVDFTTPIRFTSDTEGVTFFYTTNGSDPTTSSYSISESETVDISNFKSEVEIRVMAVKTGLSNSSITGATFTKTVSESPNVLYKTKGLTDGSEIDFSLGLTFSNITNGATIEYKWDNESYQEIEEGISTGRIPNSATSVTVRSSKTGLENSPDKTITFSMAQVDAPEFSPNSENPVNENTSFTLKSKTENATIYYGGPFSLAFNPEAPTSNGWAEYKESVSIIFGTSSSATYKAIAVKDGMKDSDEISVLYNKISVENPVFSLPDESIVTEGATFELTTGTEGAEIYYSSGTMDFDINNPESNEWNLYTNPVTIDFTGGNTVAYSAIAIKNKERSGETSVKYTKLLE